jgi:hypothetical protein
MLVRYIIVCYVYIRVCKYIFIYIYIGIVRESSWWHDLPPEGPDIHLRTVALASWSVLAVVAVWLRLQGINRLPVIAASFWQSWIVHSPVLPRQQMMVTNSHWEGCRELCQTDSTRAITLSLEPPWHLLGLTCVDGPEVSAGCLLSWIQHVISKGKSTVQTGYCR